jgi:hypothetical protein
MLGSDEVISEPRTAQKKWHGLKKDNTKAYVPQMNLEQVRPRPLVGHGIIQNEWRNDRDQKSQTCQWKDYHCAMKSVEFMVRNARICPNRQRTPDENRPLTSNPVSQSRSAVHQPRLSSHYAPYVNKRQSRQLNAKDSHH